MNSRLARDTTLIIITIIIVIILLLLLLLTVRWCGEGRGEVEGVGECHYNLVVTPITPTSTHHEVRGEWERGHLRERERERT